MRDIKAVILSAGFGTRLYALTDKTPKPLIAVGRKTILRIVIDNLASFGITDIAVNLHYMPLPIIRELHGLAIKFFGEIKPLGTAGALRPMRSWLSDPFFVVNGDTIASVDFERMLEQHRKTGALVTVFTNDDAIHCGGVYIFNKAILSHIPARTTYSIHEDLLPRLVKKYPDRIKLFTEGWYIDIGTRQGLKHARAQLSL